MVDYWDTRTAALTSLVYICIAPNPRGSTGYGLEFQKANFQDLGGADLQGEIASVEFLKATGYVDPNKIGITDGSYGGFITLMAIGKTPKVWRAAVEEYGIINWSSMLKSSDLGRGRAEWARILIACSEPVRCGWGVMKSGDVE